MTKVVASIGLDRYKTKISNGRHHLVADEPISQGTDLGPNPYDLLLMSLGSCVAMTLRMYADRKEWPLDEVEIHLRHERVRSQDCEDCESEKGYVDLIHKEIKLKGDLDDKQRQRLMEIAERCPVQKTLLNEIKVRSTELV